MNNFEKINIFIKQHPKLFFALIILMGLLISSIFPLIGIYFIIAGILMLIFLPRMFKDSQSNDVNRKPLSNFIFPTTDGHGHQALKIYDINVTGVMKEHGGVNPQAIIANLRIGEQIILEADPDNQYDNRAVKVKTLSNIQIGWLPMGENLQIDIFERLQKGQTVYARVNRIYDLDLYPGKKGLIIDVARYATR